MNTPSNQLTSILDRVQQWRLQLLDSILYSSFILGSLALLATIIDSYVNQRQQAPMIIFTSIAAYVLTIVITFAKSLSYIVRAGVFLSLLFLVMIVDILGLGLGGDARLILIAIGVLSALFFSLRTGLFTFGIGIAILVLNAWLFATQRLNIPVAEQLTSRSLYAWVASGTMLLLLMIILSLPLLFLLKRLGETASEALQVTQQATQTQQQAQNQSHQLIQHTAHIQQREQKLRGLIEQLQTPLITLADQVLLAPLVGEMNPQRAQILGNRILDAIYQQRTQLLIIDVAGVSATDPQVVVALEQIIQSVELLGCSVAISGISSGAARLFISAGHTFEKNWIVTSPKEALEHWSNPSLQQRGAP